MSHTPNDDQTKVKGYVMALKAFLNEFMAVICYGNCIECQFWNYDQNCQIDTLYHSLEWLEDGYMIEGTTCTESEK